VSGASDAAWSAYARQSQAGGHSPEVPVSSASGSPASRIAGVANRRRRKSPASQIAGLEQVFSAAVASAAFPIVFAPVEVDGIGPCVDGGVVNNTPIKWALDGQIGRELDAVVVIATSVERRAEPPGALRGMGLVSHLADMLIEERLYRDLREAEQVNDALAKLHALARPGGLSVSQLAEVMAALDWTGRRVVEIIPIRPE
jgi:predicted acylesterase/phospholipase RssA